MGDVNTKRPQILSAVVDGAWQPERTGDYAIDCVNGREIADEMLNVMRTTRSPLLFGTVVRAITESGTFGPVEIGFCSRIGIVLAGQRD